jgi:hypothetical protein
VRLLEDMLSVEFTGIAGGWLWRNGRIDNMPEVELEWFDKPVMLSER